METRFIHLFITALLMGCIAACTGKEARDNAGSHPSPCQGTFALPLPQVPDSLTTIESRAAYAILHYWDGLDFSDEARSLDTLLMEQNFANFAALLPLAPGDKAATAIWNLMDKAGRVGRAQYDLVGHIAEKYLDEPNSPMRNESVYIEFLRTMVDGNVLTDAEKLRPSHRLRLAMKNRPGDIATDFTIDLRDGSRSTLHGIAALAETTLVIFYDPDCKHCKEVMTTIADASLPAEMQVLAVDIEDDRKLWDETATRLPERWQVGFAVSSIVDDELYNLPASPTLYVIDRNSRVLLKDPGLQALGDFIDR